MSNTYNSGAKSYIITKMDLAYLEPLVPISRYANGCMGFGDFSSA